MKRWSLAILVLVFASPLPADESLGKRIDAIIRGPDYKQAHWGMLVVEAESSALVYEQSADRLFTPASTTKLYTCAAALAAFGPSYKFETPVYRRGDVTDGRLHGAPSGLDAVRSVLNDPF